MLERSELGDRTIATCLHDRYGLDGVEIKFLPLGNDSSAWVYRVSVPFGEDFFLKVRWGPLSEGRGAVPRYLRDRGIEQVVAPLPNDVGELWPTLEGYALSYTRTRGAARAWRLA